jgi:hypothetical protein
MITAGILHFMAMPERYGANPWFALLFLVIGVTQIGWAFLFAKKPSKALFLFILFLNSGLLLLWLLTQITNIGAEPMFVLNSIRKLSELVVLVVLIRSRKYILR